MKHLKFHELAEKLFNSIEKKIENFHSKSDIDCEINYNMMIITFENKSKIIINQKEALNQIWLATKKSGYHFKYKKYQWICVRTKKIFWKVLEESFLEQSNEIIEF